MKFPGQQQSRKMRALDRLQRGTFSNVGEVLDWSYYDTVLLAAATTVHQFFQIGVGSAGKTQDLTNFPATGLMPQGQSLDVRAIKVSYAGAAVKNSAGVNDVLQTMGNTFLEFKIQNKAAVYSKTLIEIMGIPLSVLATPTVAGDFLFQASQGRFVGIDVLNVPITLAALTPFTVTMAHVTAVTAGQANDRVKIVLAGRLIRAS